MWIRAIATMKSNGVATGVESIHSGGSCFETGSPWVFMVVLKKDPTLPINPTVRAIDEIVCRVMGIRSAEPLQYHIALIRPIVSIRIFKKKKIGTGRNQYTSIPKLESKWVVNFCKFNNTVGFSVVIVIRQDH